MQPNRIHSRPPAGPQKGAAVILAQAGLFVPAEEAFGCMVAFEQG